MSGKCPLGYSGDLPAGHPSVPGASSSFGNMSNSMSSNLLFAILPPHLVVSIMEDWQAWAMLLLDFVFLALCGLAFVYNDRLIFTHPRKEVPTIKPAFPLIGNTPWISKIASGKAKMIDELVKEQRRQLDQGGYVCTATFPALGHRVVLINHPLYILWAQKTNFETYDKGAPFRRAMSDVLGHAGIFVADGEIWKKQRKMASRIFSVDNFRTHVQHAVHEDLERLSQLLTVLSKTSQDVDLQAIFFRFTLSSFASMAFSARLDCLPTSPEGLANEVPFAKAFDGAQGMIDNRFFDPLQGALEYLPWNRRGRQMRKAIKVLDSFCYRVIDKRVEAHKQGDVKAAEGKSGKDLLELFMDMGLNREELLPVVLNFLIAGRDTTAQTLAWQFYQLHDKPQVVAKIREEVESVLDGGRKMAYDDIKAMPYTHAVFYETSRLHPAVPKNAKTLNKDDLIRPYAQSGAQELLADMPELKHKLPDIPMKKGESVIWSDYVMARMPEVWGADAAEFKPERFLDIKEDGSRSVKQPSPFIFHSFNAGPRLCLGQTLATFEGMAVTAAILRDFDVIYDVQALKNQPPLYAESLTHPIQPDPVTQSAYRVTFKRRSL
ncbi:cytochrome p450 [Ceraceosorus bombacis]|uniref:Cytochrome p450 n=1 Tax=Ceraceosorus bombacis TaxID=401625 RepID=A0A0P1BPP9_9BASI|nr:cytochrome p450 [Ceraceosorus bombacis]